MSGEEVDLIFLRDESLPLIFMDSNYIIPNMCSYFNDIMPNHVNNQKTSLLSLKFSIVPCNLKYSSACSLTFSASDISL